MNIRPSALVISATDWLLLIALSILWGGSFYFAKVAVLEIPPLTLALARVLIAGAVIGILIRPLGGAFPRDLATWKMFAVIAALNNAIPFTLIVWGQQYIPIGLASILNATSPLFSVVLAHFATRDDRVTPGRALGLIAGFIGVVVLIGPDLLTELGKHVWAQLALLAAAFFYAIGAIYARRLRGHKPVVIAGGQLAMATVLLLPFALAIDRPWTLAPVSGAAVWATVALAVVSTALAYLIYFRILNRAGATNALLVTFLIPVSAILLGLFLLDERLDARQFAGMLAIAIGLAAIDGRPAQFLSQKFRRTVS
jgi:drug/metabolite transporter (DMT)-like permease